MDDQKPIDGVPGDLTERQKAFVREFLVDQNATAAYIRAGYKDTPSARANAARLIAKDSIHAAVAALRKKLRSSPQGKRTSAALKS